MIIELFAILMLLSLAGVWLGYYSGDSHYAVAGLFLFFLLGIVILTGNLEYKTGETTTTAACDEITEFYYGNNFSTTHWLYETGAAPTCTNPNDPLCVWLFSTNKSTTGCNETVTTTYQYNDFTGDTAHWFGFLLSFASAAGMALTFWNYRRRTE